MYQAELNVAIKAIEHAAKAILDIYRQDDFYIETKSDNTMVTQADMAAHDILVNILAEEFPQYGILSEEGECNGERFATEYVWIIDPLDGTREFIKRNDEFTINVALVKDGRPVLGLVYVPCQDRLYYAIAGQGAFLRLKGKTETIRVSDRTRDLTLVRSRSRLTPKLCDLMEKDEITRIMKVGAALKGCLVADGTADIYYSFSLTSEWDICPVDLIVHEAGGVFRYLNGDLVQYNRVNNLNRGGFVALNTEKNYFL